MQQVQFKGGRFAQARGRNGWFKPAKSDVWSHVQYDYLGENENNPTIEVSIASSRPCDVHPIIIELYPEDWETLIAAVKAELAKREAAIS